MFLAVIFGSTKKSGNLDRSCHVTEKHYTDFLKVLIDILPVAHSDNTNYQLIILRRINNTIVSDPNPKVIISTTDFFEF